MTDAALLETRKQTARAWFEGLRDRIIARFEALEDSAPADLYPGAPGRFEKKPWDRPAGGGGVMSMMHGRFFEKVGVHTSVVFGTFTPEMARTMPGAEEDPRFFATGVSLIAHMHSPRVPAVHMNTRFICTTKGWFGGGADLTPLLGYQRQQDFPDAIAFHAAFKDACDRFDPAWHAKYKAWCDEYFFLPHRNEPRGIGGIFYDHHDSGDWDRDSPSPKPWARPSWAAIRPSRKPGWPNPGRRRSASSSWCSADATSSSTCSTTAARCSG